jgi:hypothetical protein
MADWVEGYQDELEREEQLAKIGEMSASALKDAMARPSRARIVMPATPIVVSGRIQGSMPITKLRFMGQDVDVDVDDG